mgnify:FL=1
MLITDLYNDILIKPAQAPEIDRLKIISGFATGNFAGDHMKQLGLMKKPLNVELIVGMTSSMGIERGRHLILQNLTRDIPHNINFSCRYVCDAPPVHAKAYCWCSGEKPISAFVGSANYTRTAFSTKQTEAMMDADAGLVAAFHESVNLRTISCLEAGVADRITLTQTRWPKEKSEHSVELSLLTRHGDTPTASGINWGQRENRNRDQAYINISAEINKTGFFPERRVSFAVETDDAQNFVMVRAQDSGKGLHTTNSNALLGRYLRKRMGVSSGEYVTRQHLLAYGRSTVTFTKIDDETYLMDFSV